jgi:hypothetical protein
MAATFQLIERNGAPPGTATDKTSAPIRFKNADNATVDLNNPMVVSGVSDFSFEKWIGLNITGGSYTQITNIRAYSDGGNGFGTGVLAWARAAASYAAPVQPTASTGLTFLFSLTSASPLSLGGGPYSGTGMIGSYLVLTCEVQPTAAGGVTPTEAVSFGWDEI